MSRRQPKNCVDCGAVTADVHLLHWDEVCTHCKTVREAVARTGTYDGPLFPTLPAKSECYRTYRQACELLGGTLRTLPLSEHPLLHDTWTALLPPPPPDRTMPLPEAAPAPSWATDEDEALDGDPAPIGG